VQPNKQDRKEMEWVGSYKEQQVKCYHLLLERQHWFPCKTRPFLRKKAIFQAFGESVLSLLLINILPLPLQIGVLLFAIPDNTSASIL
jgi:hypothetical protein